MAAEITSVDSPLSAQSAVADCLRVIIAAYQLMVSFHENNFLDHRVPTVTSQIGVLSSKLTSIVSDLGNHLNVQSDTQSTLAWACHKVGKDLCLKFGRVNAAHAAGKVVNTKNLIVLCSLVNVQSLGSRLQDLIGRCPDENITFQVAKIHSVHKIDTEKKSGTNRVFGHKTSTIYAEQSVNESSKKGDSKDEPMEASQCSKAVVGLSQKTRLAPASLVNDFILESLAYKTMNDREEEVTTAHKSTFDWVFHQRKPHGQVGHQVTKWLEGDTLGPIYWITGKPGSGKSTFMRYLFQNDSTKTFMAKWANGQPLLMAGFFFWTSGSRDQRSQTGLLRSLLHQLLSNNEKLIPDTFPDLWQKLSTMTTKERIRLSLEWPVKDLLAAFHRLMDVALSTSRICLFVDGLDEFDGDHLTMINFFKDLGLGKHRAAIKMCLSSRPWSVFENAFEHAVPHMKLQDLTYVDMHRYTIDKLQAESAHISHLFKRNPQVGDSLSHNVVERADGVFLWVRLAVNEMVARWDVQTGKYGLEAILQQLPTDLDDLFAKLLLRDQTALELAQTSMIFQLIRGREIVADFVKDDSANSLTIWELAFALHADDDAHTANWQVEEAKDSFISKRCDSAIFQVKHRFAGLLDLHPPARRGNMKIPRFSNTTRDVRFEATLRVAYIHRTVRDWLMEAEGVQAHLETKSPEHFDSHLRLLRSYILRLKRPLEEVEHHRRLDEWWPDIALAMTHARHVNNDPKLLQHSLLNEMNKTLSWHWLEKPQDPYDHWARNAFGSYEVRMKAPPIWQPFLCLATKFGLTRYVSEELNARSRNEVSTLRQELQPDDAVPLLTYATEFLCSRNKSIFPLSDPELIRFLLQHKCRINPGANHQYVDFMTRKPTTPWLSVLRHLRDARRRGWIEYYDINPDGVTRWATVVQLFLEQGADSNAMIPVDNWDPEISARGVLDLLDETYGLAEVRELRTLLLHKQHSTNKAQYAMRSK